jgi:hypothetical protein
MTLSQKTASSNHEKKSESNANSRAHKWLFIFSALYTFFFAGAVWGWGPMQLILEVNGSYHSLCEDGEAVCPQQTARLLTM